jgi:hypothetical protein
LFLIFDFDQDMEALLDRVDVIDGASVSEKNDALDDIVTELQDCYFEGRYRAAILLAEKIVVAHPKEEDAYDILLASHLALEQYEDVIRSSVQWVAGCGESLKQLMHCLEAAYMLGNMDLVEDVAFKLCFLFESSDHDHVFASGALLAASLCVDFDLSIPDCVDLSALLQGELLQEPLAWWLSCKVYNKRKIYFCSFIKGNRTQTRSR